MNGLNQKLENGIRLHRSGRLQDALAVYAEILESEPNNGDVLHAAGVALYSEGEYENAESHLARACAQLKGRAEAFSHWGSALQKLGRIPEAIDAHENAIALDPAAPIVLSNYGNALSDAGRVDDAVHVFKRSIDAQPENAVVWTSYSVALKGSGRLLAAVEAARKACELDPSFSGALSNLGSMLISIGQPDEAIPFLKKATELEAKNHWAWSNLIYALQYSDTTSDDDLVEATNRFGEICNKVKRIEPIAQRDSRLRIGFVSADLRQHAVARFLTPVLKASDSYPVDIYLYSDSKDDDEWSRILKACCTKWRVIYGHSDSSVAREIVGDRINLLIDLAGHTARNRLGVFAMKPSPVQATWLGFPGSTGLSTIDFRIIDDIALSSEEAEKYPEAPLYLDEGYHTIEFENGGEVVDTPHLKGAPFAFGSFNNLSKIGTRTIALWARILNAAPDSTLVLKSYQLKDSGIRKMVEDKFELAGVSKERLRLLDPVPDYTEHLASYGSIDLCLDPIPYNGTTTSCEALYMGVPVLTLLGTRSNSRVGASLLTEIGLDAFICESEEAYFKSAVSWTCRPKELNMLRHRLRDEFLRSSLGNGKRFAAKFFPALLEAHDGKLSAANYSPLPEGENWIEHIDFESGPNGGNILYPFMGATVLSQLKGCDVLDASCVDGFWALKALEHGAKTVVCLPAEGFLSILETGYELARSSYFDLARKRAGFESTQMRLVAEQVYQLNPKTTGMFDWVFLNVNVNSLRHLFFALDSIRSVCRLGLMISMAVSSLELEIESEESLFRLNDGPFWLPTVAGLRRILTEAQFTVEHVELVRDESGNSIASLVAKTK